MDTNMAHDGCDACRRYRNDAGTMLANNALLNSAHVGDDSCWGEVGHND